jgi:hypothetical protein
MVSSIGASKSYSSDLLDSLSKILDREIDDGEFNDLLIFIAVLAASIVGVIAADGKVTLQEKRRLNSIWQHFISKGHPGLFHSRQIGIIRSRVYRVVV